MTDDAIIVLLRQLDLEARRDPYPPLGLGVYGEGSQLRVTAYIGIVRSWLASMQPECSR